MDDRNHAEPASKPSQGSGNMAAKATLWLVLLASVGVIVFVGLRFSDLQRDPELEFNITKLEGEDHDERLKGLDVLKLIAAERSTDIAPRKIERAFPALTAALKDSNPDIRIRALIVFQACGFVGESAAPDIRELLEDHEPAIRMAAIIALAAVAREDSKTISSAVAAARDDNVDVARAGVIVLSTLGERSRPAVDALLEIAKRPELRESVAKALKAIEPEAISRLP